MNVETLTSFNVIGIILDLICLWICAKDRQEAVKWAEFRDAHDKVTAARYEALQAWAEELEAREIVIERTEDALLREVKK